MSSTSIIKSSLIMMIQFWVMMSVAQEQKMLLPQLNETNHILNKGSEIQKTSTSGTINPHQIKDNWQLKLINTSKFEHTSMVSTDAFKILKAEVNSKRINTEHPSSTELENRKSIDTAFINQSFRGNNRMGSVPMDNSMAISRNGFIVSAINSNVVFTNPEGKITFEKGFPDFFTLLGLGTRMYDPRVIYDVEQNKFIFMCLHGSEPSNTFLCIAFSKTEDPNGEWNYYKIDGNPSGDNNWFDYPNIAISKDDYYISGLMRNTSGNWQYSVVYQISKSDGYQNKNLTWKYFNEIRDADQSMSFNLVPAQSGWSSLNGPGMYFVSNKALGGSTYNFYYTNGSLSDNPSIISMQIQGQATELAPDGRQMNTTNVLNTFDSRIWSAMYLDSIIHMGSHVNTPNGDVGLFYGRLNVSNLELHSQIYTEDKRDYGFPSFSAFSRNGTNDTILINYLVSGPEMFPGQEQRVCVSKNGNFEWSEKTTLKQGTSIINTLSDDNERWGDYTTSCRRFFDDRQETWVTGCFGEQNSYGTWLGQLITKTDAENLVFAEFVADKTTLPKSGMVQFKDLTKNNPLEWTWSFEGGIPNTSTLENPIISYPIDGAYDVTLIVKSTKGIDTITKIDYIHIQDAIQKPKADFKTEKDTIYIDDSVQFINLSSPNTEIYKWTFPQGNPSSSTDISPNIKYTKTGSFLASLTVSNIAGNDTKIVVKAIIVTDRKTPIAQFSSNKSQIVPGESINFKDLSSGGPLQWEWSFEGGTPAISSDQNPEVKYNSEGTFAVTLKASNIKGENTVTKTAYIKVGQVSTEEVPLVTKLVCFPNPVSGGLITLKFELSKTQKIRFELFNANGLLIKTLYNDKIKTGENELMFNTDSLSSGLYFVRMSGPNLMRTIDFMVVK